MRVAFSIALWGIVAAVLIGNFLPTRYPTDFDIEGFGQLPVQDGGRIKPIDTLARDALIQFSGKQSVKLPDGGGRISPTLFFLELAMRPEMAHTFPVFRVDNVDVRNLIGQAEAKGKYFSYEQLAPFIETVAEQAVAVPTEAHMQSVYDQHLLDLYGSLKRYTELGFSIHPKSNLNTLQGEYEAWVASIGPGMAALQAQQAGQSYDEDAFYGFIGFSDRYLELAQISTTGIAPDLLNPESVAWLNVGSDLLESIPRGGLSPALAGYANAIAAWRMGDVAGFNGSVEELEVFFDPYSSWVKMGLEAYFNDVAPFAMASMLYLLIFVATLVGWMLGGVSYSRQVRWVVLVAFTVHSVAILARMYIQGRPPVTDLYSSALFIGWGSVLMSLFMERVYRNGMGNAAAGLIGWSTLLIAHNLRLESGDTMGAMQAVLDSNFWLATHVVTITIGYSAVFLAGGIAAIHTLRQAFGSVKKAETAKVVKLVYAAICVGTLFSFVGTLLGGIWADQSWGRFWGWDPKENGALIIVLWCGLILHAKIGRLMGERGLLVLAIAGNIVTAWSWFGTNMLGIGLHSYGFTQSAFWALAGFVVSQLLLMVLQGRQKKTA